MPVPGVWNLDNFNLRLPGRCLELGDKDHYRKGESQTGLFDEDRKALLPLPAKPFDVVTWTRMKADKYGNITVQGRHRYAAGPECVCSIESGPCERVDVFHVSGRFWSTSACGEKRTPARPAWTSFPS